MLQPIFQKVVAGQDLSEQEAEYMMDSIMGGEMPASLVGGFLTALSMKGETVEEITGCARAMRGRAAAVATQGPVVDTCGTGGDKKHTFNISTAAAFVSAGAGLAVAKHGNRSVSSKCGSADVLEALGININLNGKAVEQCLTEVGLGFLFAPVFHTAMKNVVGPRRELGIRTIFNILGPLTNPAGAESQLLGVFEPELTATLAGVLAKLGSKKALVVHGTDGLDEVTICGSTKVTELQDGRLNTYFICPEDFGMQTARMEEIIGGDAAKNAKIIMSILQGEQGAKRDIVVLNAAAALSVGGLANSIAAGVAMAADSIDSGKALAKFNDLKKFTTGVLLQ